MNKELKIFKGLYGDNSYSPILDFIHHEPLAARSKMYNWEINEHLHTDLFQLFLIESGNGLLISEKNKTEIDGHCIILIPTNTLHGFSFHDNICGEVITFSENFFESLFSANQKILNEISRLFLMKFQENSTDFTTMISIKNMIINELKEDKLEKQIVLESLFKLLFFNIYRQAFSQKAKISETDNRTLKYFQAFQKNIKQSILDSKTVGQYALELNISTMHLNRICQNVVQKSPIQIIHDQLISEAKKYLLNTSYSISEISYFLNFNDPAYFTRLFKKIVGVSPSDFRKS